MRGEKETSSDAFQSSSNKRVIFFVCVLATTHDFRFKDSTVTISEKNVMNCRLEW